MLDGGMLIGWIIKVLALIFKVVLKGIVLFLRVGGWWLLIPMGIALSTEWITGKSLGSLPMVEQLVDILFWVCLFFLVPMTIAQNLIRVVKKDPTFSWLKLFKGMKEEKGFEAKLDGKEIALKRVTEISGVVFGKEGNKYATMPESTDGHILVVGGAGSGKTASIAIPTLMSWKERIFAIDIKGELYQKTKGARNTEMIKVFNPTDRGAFGYDPYYVLKHSDDVSSSARQLAMSIIPLPAETKDPFWIKGAQNLLTGLVIYHFEQGLSFSETMLAIKATPIKELVTQIMVDEESSLKARAHISEFSGMDEKTLSGVFSELSNHITVFATNDELQRALSGNGACITPADLENGYDIYCCIPEHKIDEWKDLLGMMCNQFLKSFEQREEGNKTPILFLIDEFPRLGKIEAISNGLATLRSKKIHIALIIQSKGADLP